MQEDNFLNQYRSEWQQDNKEMEQALADITLEQLHESIAQHEADRHRRRWLWPTVSAAACLALLVTVGIGITKPTATADRQPILAQNTTLRKPVTLTADAADATTARQENHPGTPHILYPTQTREDIAEAIKSEADLPVSEEPSTEAVLKDAIEEKKPSTTAPLPSNTIETHRLVAYGENTLNLAETETQLLVNIVPPPRNSFHEAVIEPLLALVTQDLED